MSPHSLSVFSSTVMTRRRAAVMRKFPRK
ncbi:hypothetical protein E2C01_064350 [Portunus trituberculatus]|uniref:Uncharacterized protein n=1 Tax=Portunus trituberculatus TaxID=210409 RepID=A0A5B7HBG3_PORTR|nr:hypothetical protein [Portunus trituberculatus]